MEIAITTNEHEFYTFMLVGVPKKKKKKKSVGAIIIIFNISQVFYLKMYNNKIDNSHNYA